MKDQLRGHPENVFLTLIPACRQSSSGRKPGSLLQWFYSSLFLFAGSLSLH